MRKCMKRFLAIVLALCVLALLPGCGQQSNPTGEHLPIADAPWMAGQSPVPDRRTGLYRQGSDGAGNLVEYTASGIYYLSQGDDYLLYCDHDSDTFIPLCSRPDCGHGYDLKDYHTCDAYWPAALGICFYDGYLYVVMDDADVFCIKRVKPDGTDRELVYTLDAELSAYYGWSGVTIWQGVVTYTITSLDDEGNRIDETFFYKLDGSMEKPTPVQMEYPRGNHGDTFIISGDDGFYAWDGKAAQATYLTEYLGNGYYTTEEAYVVLDGVISKVTYATGEVEALLDTGLEGTYDLLCYPDCLIVMETLPFVDIVAGTKLEPQHLYFYNWEFTLLGSLEVEADDAVWPPYTVFFETATRIYLSLEHTYDPSHYIEKSDFGTGNIVLHKVTLPWLPMLETGSF